MKLEIFVQLAGILASLHESNIQHNDIKLENIMVESDSFGQLQVKIGDFGSSFRSKSSFKKKVVETSFKFHEDKEA
jgi:serine/threonine protein kinase